MMREPSGVMAISRSLAITVIAAGPLGEIVKRATRGAGGRVANHTAAPAAVAARSAVTACVAARITGEGRDVAADAAPAASPLPGVLAGSSSTNSTTEMSAIRLRQSLSRHRLTIVRIARGTSAGSALQSGSL